MDSAEKKRKTHTSPVRDSYGKRRADTEPMLAKMAMTDGLEKKKLFRKPSTQHISNSETFSIIGTMPMRKIVANQSYSTDDAKVN